MDTTTVNKPSISTLKEFYAFDPSNSGLDCMTCGASLERGWSSSVTVAKGSKTKVASYQFVCHNCHFQKQINEYADTSQLSSSLITTSLLKLLRCFGCDEHLKSDYLRARRNFILHPNDQEAANKVSGYEVMFPALKVFRSQPGEAVLMEINTSYEEINTRIARFDEDVWFAFNNPLSKIVRSADCRYLSAQGKKFKMLIGSLAGRVMITIQDRYKMGDKRSIFGGAWVSTLQSEDDDRSHMGLQGLCGTEKEIVGLLEAAITEYPTLKIKLDSKLSMM